MTSNNSTELYGATPMLHRAKSQKSPVTQVMQVLPGVPFEARQRIIN
jgi:hypothetical protein